jgi:glycosyltransferase involved in cell wall biosynthesis
VPGSGRVSCVPAVNSVRDSNSHGTAAAATANAPRLSVGLAVYNGERYLAEAIDAILEQTFADFELIISDNASTDMTPEICAVYASKDRRVKYHRNGENIGGANNENLTFMHARGRYFRWAADDDLCEPTLFEKCVEVLERDPEVVLAYTRSVTIDADGNPIREVGERRGMSARASDRFRELADRQHLCEASYGIIRTSALRSTGLQRNYVDSDRVLLAALSLRGRFVQLDEALFKKRRHERNEFYDWRARMNWFTPGSKRRIRLPNWIEAAHLAYEVVRAPVPVVERVRSLVWVGEWVWRQRRPLVGDVAYSFRSLVRRPAGTWRYNWE